MRDQVFARDHGKCVYVGKTGRRCGSTHALQIDHITFSTVGRDRIKCLKPRALFQLPLLRIISCRDATGIEAEITSGATFPAEGAAGADGSAGAFRASPVNDGDWGVIYLDGEGDHNLFFQFVPPERPIPGTRFKAADLLAPARVDGDQADLTGDHSAVSREV